jgi:hypothetical protein
MNGINLKDILVRALHATPLRIAILLFFLQPVTAQRLVTPFSGKLPSEIYLASLYPENTLFDITTNEHNLLFGPSVGPPPGTGDGGGGAVGETLPVKDCLWGLVLGCLAYGIYCRKKLSHSKNASALSRRDKASGTDAILVARRFNAGDEMNPSPPERRSPDKYYMKKIFRGFAAQGFAADNHPALKRRATNILSLTGQNCKRSPTCIVPQGQHFINRMLQLPDMMQAIQPQSRRDGTLLSEP